MYGERGMMPKAERQSEERGAAAASKPGLVCVVIVLGIVCEAVDSSPAVSSGVSLRAMSAGRARVEHLGQRRATRYDTMQRPKRRSRGRKTWALSRPARVGASPFRVAAASTVTGPVNCTPTAAGETGRGTRGWVWLWVRSELAKHGRGEAQEAGAAHLDLSKY